MRVLVTGAAGFIGSVLVDRLLGRGDEVVGLDNFDPYYPPAIKRANLTTAARDPRFRLAEADVRDADRIAALLREVRPDAVVHLAALAGVRPSIERPGPYISVNVGGTTNLMDAACKLDPPPRFIYASSSSIYGERTIAPFRESDPVDHPVSPYAASKRSCELFAHTFHHIYGFAGRPASGFFTAYKGRGTGPTYDGRRQVRPA